MVENAIAVLEPDFDLDLVIVYRRSGPTDQLVIPPGRVHSLGTRRVLWPQLMPTSLVYPLRVGRALRRIVRRIEPDALLVQDGIFLPIPGLLAVRGTSTKLVVMDHGTISNTLDPRWQRMFPRQYRFPKNLVYRAGFALDKPWRAVRWRMGFRRADEVWYRASELVPLIEQTGARARRYADILPRGFSPRTPESRAAARRHLGVPEDATVVNIVSRIAVEKGLPLILDGLEAVTPAHPSLVVLVAGDGPLEGWMRGEIERRGLPVRQLGWLNRAEVERVHHASDYHLYAGEIACGVTVALLEAMLAGVVPIVSDVPREHAEVVGNAGWVFPAGDLPALRRCLSEALSSPAAEWERRSASAIARVHLLRGPGLTELVEGLFRSDDRSAAVAPRASSAPS